MKRKVTALLTALLLTLTLCVPTLAWTEYGAIYDETDALGSDELSDLGQYTLPQLTEALHLDLRVDIFTNEDVSEGTTAGDIATYVYKDSGYGWGEEKDGISLTLVMEPLADGSYTLAETDWCVYAMLSETRGDGQELSGLVYDAVEPYLNNAQSWTGEDMAASAEALCQAVNAKIGRASSGNKCHGGDGGGLSLRRLPGGGAASRDRTVRRSSGVGQHRHELCVRSAGNALRRGAGRTGGSGRGYRPPPQLRHLYPFCGGLYSLRLW